MGKFESIKSRDNIQTHADKEDELLKLKTQVASQKKGGRPKKSEEDTLSEKVVLLFTKREMEMLKEKSHAIGIPFSIFAKAAVKKALVAN